MVLISKVLFGGLEKLQKCPDMMNYALTLDKMSVVNTPFTLCTLVLEENIRFLIENSGPVFKKIQENKERCVEYLRRLNI